MNRKKVAAKVPKVRAARSLTAGPNPPLDSQSIGDRAEDAFKQMCTEAKIVANPPLRDRRGWDLVLDCPFPEDTRTSDWVARPTQITCFAQIKGSLSDSGSVGISLFHLERMAKERIPWFVPVVVLADTAPHRPTAVYLVHVDEALTKKIVKRLFESSLVGKSILDQTMEVTWTQADAVQLAGDAILARIRAKIPDVSGYADTKKAWLDSGAAELRRLSGTMTFYYRSDARIYDALARLAIGELEYIPLRSFSAKGDILKKLSGKGSVRWGASTLHIEPFDNGATEIELASKQGVARLVCSTRSAQTAVPSLPAEHNRIRFDSRFLKFVVRADASALTWNMKLLNLEGLATLAELETAAKAIHILSSDGAVVTVTTPWGGKGKYVANEVLELEDDSRNFTLSVMHVCEIARAFGVTSDSLTIDVAKLLRQARRLLLLRSVVDNSLAPDGFSIWLDTEPTENEASIIVCPGIDLGPKVFIASGAVTGRSTSKPENSGYRLSIAEPTMRQFDRAMCAADEWDESVAARMMEAGAAQLRKEDAKLIITAEPPMTVLPPATIL